MVLYLIKTETGYKIKSSNKAEYKVSLKTLSVRELGRNKIKLSKTSEEFSKIMMFVEEYLKNKLIEIDKLLRV